jgi:hypothetical protein
MTSERLNSPSVIQVVAFEFESTASLGYTGRPTKCGGERAVWYEASAEGFFSLRVQLIN